MVTTTPPVRFSLNEKLYLKDPHSSDLGRKILTGSIDLIDELGFEAFTFKKLAQEIGSTEASAYRYFESKHKVLLYLSAYYWTWTEYRLLFRLANIPSPTARLKIAITSLTEKIEVDSDFSHIDEVKLNRIIISESSKAYLTKEVDNENRDGIFLSYKRLVQVVCNIVLEINSAYKYPHMLVSAMIEGSNLQRYFATHLPKLTDTLKGEDAVTSFYQHLVFRAITDDSKN